VIEIIGEILLNVLLYGTAYCLVPLLTLGKVYVEPRKGREVGNTLTWFSTSWYERQANGTILISADIGIVIGVILWILIALGINIIFF